jgi:excisionase family DNA binding protein
MQLPDPRTRPTLTVEEAAAILGIGRGSAYQAVQTGALPALRIGRRLLVPTAVIHRLLGLQGPEPVPDAVGGDLSKVRIESPEELLDSPQEGQ